MKKKEVKFDFLICAIGFTKPSISNIVRTRAPKKTVTELSYAAYLGRKLTRAELALEVGLYYVRNGA